MNKKPSNSDQPIGPTPLTPMPSNTPRVGPKLSRPGAGEHDKPRQSPSPDGPQSQEAGTQNPYERKGSDQTQDSTKSKKATRTKGKRRSLRPKAMKEAVSFALDKAPGPIVPRGTIAGHALVLVIAIMSFLAALTVASVTIISDATRDWQSDISRGATIQIRNIDGVDIEAELAKAMAIATKTQGITSATVLSSNESNALLEPWLGLDLAFDDLPVPRLIELTIDDPTSVDFASLSQALQTQVSGAILDNHRFWVERLRSMADTAILVGFTILLLVITATVLTVVFATRSTMAGTKETIEVLHFVGASNKFIAGEFQRKFFALGFKGAFAGGGAAMITFLILQMLVRGNEGSAALDQMQALLGVVELGYTAYIGTFALIILIAVFTAITTRLTVMNTLSKLS